MSIRVHAAWAAGTAILLMLSRFLLLAVLARQLDPQALGLFAYLQWMVDIAFLVGSLGAGGAASRYLAEYRSRPVLLQSFIKLWRLPSLLLPLAAAVLALLGAHFTGVELDWQGQAALFAWALFAGLWAMQSSALTGLQRFGLLFLGNLVSAVVMLLGVALVPIAPNDPSTVLLIMSAGCAIAYAVGMVPIHNLSASNAGLIVPIDTAAIRHYCMNIWLTAILWNLVWSRGELPLVRHFLGDASLASYSVALSVIGAAVGGVMLGIGGIAPQVTRLLGEGLVDEAVDVCRLVGDWQLLLSGSAAGVLIWLAPELLRLGFGPSYASAAPALALLAAGLPALSFSMHNHLLQIQTGARFNRDSTLFGLLALGLVAVLLIPRFGIEGAAMARAAALWLMAVVSMAAFSRRVGTAGLNRFGFSTVMLMTSTSAGAVALLPALPLGVRAALAVSMPLVLLFAIRSNDGHLAISAMWRSAVRQ